jgi:hypothetical protein
MLSQTLGIALIVLASAAESVEVDCTLAGNAVLVPVDLQGVGPYPFILDAGTRDLVVNRDVAGYLKLDLSADHGTTAFTAPLAAAGVGGTALPQDTTLVMDLSGFSERMGIRVAGILPACVPGKELTLDIVGNRLILSDLPETAGETASAPARAEALRALAAAVPPTVRGLINGQDLRTFVVDTTFAGAVGLPEWDLRELGLLRDDTAKLVIETPPAASEAPPSPWATLTGGMQIRLKALRVGAAQMDDPVCVVLEGREPPRIGLGFLRHFRARFALDAAGVSVRIERADAASVRDGPVVGCGISLVQCQQGFWRIAVACNSSAARAGIASGDPLVQVDGEDMRDQPYTVVLEGLAAEEGEPVEVTVRRGDKDKTVRLVAERLL